MQRRLLISMIAVAVAAVLALGLPLGFVLTRLQFDEANQQLHRDAQTVANSLQERWDSSLPPDATQLALALAAVGIAVVLGLGYARRLLRPLQELATAADRLGSGDSSPLGRRYGIQELD